MTPEEIRVLSNELEEVASRLSILRDLAAHIHMDDGGDELRVVVKDTTTALGEIIEGIYDKSRASSPSTSTAVAEAQQ